MYMVTQPFVRELSRKKRHAACAYRLKSTSEKKACCVCNPAIDVSRMTLPAGEAKRRAACGPLGPASRAGSSGGGLRLRPSIRHRGGEQAKARKAAEWWRKVLASVEMCVCAPGAGRGGAAGRAGRRRTPSRPRHSPAPSTRGQG